MGIAQQTDTTIIGTPDGSQNDESGGNTSNKFGYFVTINTPHRKIQEDSFACHLLNQQDLTSKDTSLTLNLIDLGHRLWTTYQLLDEHLDLQPAIDDHKPGSTAATVIYDGKGNLITGLLADAAAFVVLYDKNGEVLGATRLNSLIHNLTNPLEEERIQKAGGSVTQRRGDVKRVNDNLEPTRAIGDGHWKAFGICADAQIDITNLQTIKKEWEVSSLDFGSAQVIVTSDGFTDAAGEQSKQGHERYLLHALKNIKTPGLLTEQQLTKELGAFTKPYSRDNITLIAQTITHKTPPFLAGVYDGHGGTEASTYTAINIGRIFKEQCALTHEAYTLQKFSTNTKKLEYARDNCDPNLSLKAKEQIQFEVARVSGILNDLATKIGSLGATPQHPWIKASDRAQTLLLELRWAAYQYEADLRSPHVTAYEAKNSFSHACNKTIEKAKSFLENDLSWVDYLCNLLKSLCNAPIYVLSGVNQFFALEKSPSMQHVETARGLLTP